MYYYVVQHNPGASFPAADSAELNPAARPGAKSDSAFAQLSAPGQSLADSGAEPQPTS